MQGFRHTRDLRAYARRLLLLACVSEIPFDLLIFGQISSAMEQNVVFALLLGLMALYAAKAACRRPAVRAGRFSADAAGDGGTGELWLAGRGAVSGLCLCGRQQKRQALFTVLLTLLYAFTLLLSGVARTWGGRFSLCGALGHPIALYNGRPGPRGKALTFFFYAAYPLHLCALALIRVMRIIRLTSGGNPLSI